MVSTVVPSGLDKRASRLAVLVVDEEDFELRGIGRFRGVRLLDFDCFEFARDIVIAVHSVLNADYSSACTTTSPGLRTGPL
jgi:hypothetical protein